MRIYLTDPLTIESGDTIVRQHCLPGWQGRTLLAMLVLNRRRSVSKDEIASELWGEHRPATWDGAIRLLIHKLRRSLDGAFGLDFRSDEDGAYRCISPGEFWVDIDEAQCLVSNASAAAKRGDLDSAYTASVAAMRIAERKFLPGGSGGPWTANEQRRLDEIGLASRVLIANVHLSKRRYSECVSAAEAIIALDPYNESAYRTLMQAWSARDERAHAVATYRRCEKVLYEDLGVAPSTRTRVLAQIVAEGKWSEDLLTSDSVGAAVNQTTE